MRITKLFTLIAICFSSLTINASDVKPTLSEQLKAYILKSDIKVVQEYNITVNFLVNKDNEIIVISTSSKNYDGAIKNAIQNRKVEGDDVEINKIYTLPIKMKKM